MLGIFVIYLILVLYKSKFEIKGTADYLAIENTNCVKGIFILMVFLSHFNSYIGLTGRYDEIYLRIFSTIGQAMVTMFMFYSGYGIMESIKKKGDSYVSSIPFKRVLGTLFRFDLAIALFLILALITSRPMTAKNVLLSLIGWESLGNSNWYIFVILVLYVITFIAFKIFGTKKLFLSASVTTVLVAGVVMATMIYEIKESWWYDTALCFAVGLLYSLFKDTIVKMVNKNIVLWFVFTTVFGAAFYTLRPRCIVFQIISNICFTLFFVILTMRITFNNKALKWCGEHLFEIYILQRIPMIVFQRVTSIQSNIYLYFALCLAVTVIMTIGFKYAADLVWNKLTSKKRT